MKSTAGKALRVLVVDDNPVNQKVAIGLVERCGFSAVAAVNGQEALRMLEQDGPEIVLMDIHMPVMDGLEATRQLRKRESGESAGALRKIIIALTTLSEESDRLACREAGMDDFIAKPIRFELLEMTLKKWSECLKCEQAMVRNASQQREAVAAPVVEDSAVDFGRLEEFTGRDPASTQELLNLYLTQTTGQLAELGQAIREGNIRQVERLAHSAHGASASCGIRAILPPLARLERQAHEGQSQGFEALREEALRQFDRVRVALADYRTSLNI